MSGSNGKCEHPDCLKQLAQVRSTLYGNGHPEESLIVRVCNIEKQTRTTRRLLVATLSGVATLVLQVIGSWISKLF